MYTPERTSVGLQKREISMSNDLARSSQSLKLSEKRTIALAMIKTDSIHIADAVDAKSKGGWIVKVTAAEYAEVYGVERDTAYTQLKASAKSLTLRKVKYFIRTKSGLQKVEIRWVSQCNYIRNEALIEITFTAEVGPHLLALKGKFTNYKLLEVSALRSIYSWRLFECLRSWSGTGRWIVSIEDFQRAMDAPDSAKEGFGQLDRRILQPALKELRENVGMIIDVQFEKVGRKITNLIFSFNIIQKIRIS